MKLIKEVYEELNFLTEETNGEKQHFIEGVFLQANLKNRNGRMYPKDVLKNEVQRYTEEYINKNRAFGELGHPDTPTINLDRVSHMIKSLHEVGNDFHGKAKIMDTPYGNIVKNLMKEGARLGVSSRGMGSLKAGKDGVNLVQDDFHLATAADIVADPSAPDAFVRGIMEDKEWMLVNGIWTEMHQEQAKKIIQKTSSRQLEEMKLHLFKTFIGKL